MRPIRTGSVLLDGDFADPFLLDDRVKVHLARRRPLHAWTQSGLARRGARHEQVRRLALESLRKEDIETEYSARALGQASGTAERPSS